MQRLFCQLSLRFSSEYDFLLKFGIMQVSLMTRLLRYKQGQIKVLLTIDAKEKDPKEPKDGW